MIWWQVFRKEWKDALRDRRTLLALLMSSVLMGPLMLVLVSSLASDLEAKSSSRVVTMTHIEQAPRLKNYFERQGFNVEQAPADFELRLKKGALDQAVVDVPEGFEKQWLEGEKPTITVYSHSSNRASEINGSLVMKTLRGFNQETGMLSLVLDGGNLGVMQSFDVDDVDLADSAARAMQLTSLVPTFVLMAVVYGVLTSGMDSTAGERERGSLEPLLMTPVQRGTLVMGKWLAVSALGLSIAVLSCLSFFPAQAMLRSESLQAMFHYGPHEALWFILILAPMALVAGALVMAVSVRAKTVKEAQASATLLVMALTMVPMFSTMLNQTGAEKAWHLWVPGLSQTLLMNRVLKGEAVSPLDYASFLLVGVLLSAAALWTVSRQLQKAALKGA